MRDRVHLLCVWGHFQDPTALITLISISVLVPLSVIFLSATQVLGWKTSWKSLQCHWQIFTGGEKNHCRLSSLYVACRGPVDQNWNLFIMSDCQMSSLLLPGLSVFTINTKWSAFSDEFHPDFAALERVERLGIDYRSPALAGVEWPFRRCPARCVGAVNLFMWEVGLVTVLWPDIPPPTTLMWGRISTSGWHW